MHLNFSVYQLWYQYAMIPVQKSARMWQSKFKGNILLFHRSLTFGTVPLTWKLAHSSFSSPQTSQWFEYLWVHRIEIQICNWYYLPWSVKQRLCDWVKGRSISVSYFYIYIYWANARSVCLQAYKKHHCNPITNIALCANCSKSRKWLYSNLFSDYSKAYDTVMQSNLSLV